MKKVIKKLTCLILSVIMVIPAVPFVSLVKPIEAKAVQYTNGQLIEFGSYPQRKVRDSATLSALNALPLNWISYGYMSGRGTSYDDGSAQPSDYMKYADVTYNGSKYRAVTFSTYRPVYTNYQSTSSTPHTYQADNGYYINNVYWFKYEPIVWRILDTATGLVMSETILDSQAYSDTLYYNGNGDYKDSAHTIYANNYYESTIRQWLNNDFYTTAFPSSQTKYINTVELENSAYSSSYSWYDSQTSYDKVFLASYNDMLNTNYGFSSSYSTYDTARRAKGSDYAKCQGLRVSTSIGYWGNGYWRLRSAGEYSDYATLVNYHGYVGNNLSVNDTSLGIRPLLQLNLISGIFSSYNPSSSVMKKSDGTVTFETHDAEMKGSVEGAGGVWKIIPSSSKKIKGVSASYGSAKITVDESVNIEKSSFFSSDISFTKNGYYDFKIPQIVSSSFLADSKQEVNMVKNPNDSLPYISTVYGRKNPCIDSDTGEYVELRTKSLAVDEFSYDGAGGAIVNTYDIIITAGNIASSAEYYIVQNGRALIKNTSGIFTSQELYSKLDANKEVFAYVKSNGKFSRAVSLKIEKQTSPLSNVINSLSQGTLNLCGTGGTGFTLSDDMPIIGGMDVSFDGTKFPIGFEVSGDTIRVSLGINIFHGKATSENGGKWKSSDDNGWLKWKNQVDQINIGDTVKAQNNWNKFLNSKDFKDLYGGEKTTNRNKNFDFDMLGYMEISYANGRNVITAFGGSVKLKAAVSAKGQWAVFNASVEFGGTATAALDVAKTIADADFPYEWKITLGLEPQLKLTAGVGWQGVLGAGIYGEGSVPINYKPVYYQSKWSHRFTIGAKGELGAYADFIFVHNTYPFITQVQMYGPLPKLSAKVKLTTIIPAYFPTGKMYISLGATQKSALMQIRILVNCQKVMKLSLHNMTQRTILSQM